MMISVSTNCCSDIDAGSSACRIRFSALELEGLGHDTDRQNTQFACGLRNDRGGPGSGSAAHARGEPSAVASSPDS